MIRKIISLAVFFLIFGVFILSSAFAASVKLKIAVVNPLENSSQSTPVTYDLPKGIGPENIINSGGMELKYDFDKENYFVYKVVDLKPAERKILEIELEDVWSISPEELSFFKDHTDELIAKLNGTKHLDTAQALSGKIQSRLDTIVKKQNDTVLNAREKINAYYDNIGVLKEVKNDLGMLENLVLDVGGVVEERVQVPDTLSIALLDESSLSKASVDLKIRVTNPSQSEKKNTPLKYHLPQEVTSRYVLDNAGLDLAYDFNKESFYLYKDGLILEPGQTRVFNVKIADIWQIPQVELDALWMHTKNLMFLIDGTPYAKQGRPLADKIYRNIDVIIKYQGMKVAAQTHIAYYRSNLGTLDKTKKYVAQLEKLITQSGATAGVTITESSKIKSGGKDPKKTRGFEGLVLIAQSIFRGKAPTVATTWKIIYAILIFIGVVAAVFFFFWYKQAEEKAKKEKEEDMAGTIHDAAKKMIRDKERKENQP